MTSLYRLSSETTLFWAIHSTKVFDMIIFQALEN